MKHHIYVSTEKVDTIYGVFLLTKEKASVTIGRSDGYLISKF